MRVAVGHLTASLPERRLIVVRLVLVALHLRVVEGRHSIPGILRSVRLLLGEALLWCSLVVTVVCILVVLVRRRGLLVALLEGLLLGWRRSVGLLRLLVGSEFFRHFERAALASRVARLSSGPPGVLAMATSGRSQ